MASKGLSVPVNSSPSNTTLNTHVMHNPEPPKPSTGLVWKKNVGTGDDIDSLRYMDHLELFCMNPLPKSEKSNRSNSHVTEPTRYGLSNRANELAFIAEQDSWQNKKKVVTIMNHKNQVVMKIMNNIAFGSSIFCGYCCFGHEVTIVGAEGGPPLGYIKQKGSYMGRAYDILDDRRKVLFTIQVPLFYKGWFPNESTELIVNDAKKPPNKYGLIKHVQNSVASQSGFTLRLGLEFDNTLTPPMKALLVGFLFHINSFYFDDLTAFV